ncbi:hypothetical protein B7494_g4695 [Chlorociboria aeruginascens]|nr:hypothetical protein B7494_g4695 [Chlorociboria aeruginascens]
MTTNLSSSSSPGSLSPQSLYTYSPQPEDFPNHAIQNLPGVSPNLRSKPPSPACSPAPQPSSPPRLPTDPLWQLPIEPNPAEVILLKLASSAGSLQDVHQILSQFIVTQAPNPTTGELWLYQFSESITEAIINNDPIILSYLFFMHVGIPHFYLSSAIEARSSAIFQVFLDYGWQINKPLQRTMPPALGYVCDDDALALWFLDHGANPNASCAWDFTAMSKAMHHASLNTIRTLFSRGGDVKKGQLLHNAMFRDKPDAIELVGLLLDMGALINEIHYENHSQSFVERCAFALGTPLHYAAQEDKPELVSYLLQRGADPSIRDTAGMTVLERAEFMQKPRVVKAIQSDRGSFPDE